jgi:uncharacterized protein YxeA
MKFILSITIALAVLCGATASITADNYLAKNDDDKHKKKKVSSHFALPCSIL